MKAKDLNGKSPGGKRTKLIDVIPLDTPIIIQVFPYYGCNFKCSYCLFSISKKKRHFISDIVRMDWNLHSKFLKGLKQFPKKPKLLRYVGIGEPLLHNKISLMILAASTFKVAEKIEIITNAFLLSNKMSDSLIISGLDRLVISIQGLSNEKYEKVSKVNIDFDKFVNNIKYFYERKNKTHVYIKIIDTSLENKEEEQKFYDIFGNICDSISIEKTVPIHQNIEYNKKLNKDKTQFGLDVKDIKICSQPYYTMQVNPDGNVVPCYSFEYPKIMGNCNDKSVYDIWNGKKFENFRKNMILKNKDNINICKGCNISKFRLFPEDNLDEYKEKLKKIYL